MSNQDITLTEREQIEELRKRFAGKMKEDLYNDDNMFVRFIRARKTLNASEEMLKNHLYWREVIKLDTLKDYKPLEVIEKYFPLTRLGFDIEGCPVNYVEYGNLDATGLCKCARISDVELFSVAHLEQDLSNMKMQSQKFGSNIDKWVVIFNYENFTFANATNKSNIELLIHLLKLYDGNYPERLKTAYLVNASFYFTLCWTLLTPFVSANTHQKIRIFGKDGWQEELKKIMGADQLPAFLGGNRCDPDGNPRCNSFIKHGGEIPQSFYLVKNRDSFTSLPGVKKILVNRRSRVDIKLEVPAAASTIEFSFDVKQKDIGFSVIYRAVKKTSAEDKEIVPKTRVDTELYSETGIVKCEKPGTYILRFDNTFSWVHAKEVYYLANVVEPNETKPNDVAHKN